MYNGEELIQCLKYYQHKGLFSKGMVMAASVGTLIIIIHLIFCFLFVVIFLDISRPKTLQEIAFLTDRRPSLVIFPFKKLLDNYANYCIAGYKIKLGKLNGKI